MSLINSVYEDEGWTLVVLIYEGDEWGNISLIRGVTKGILGCNESWGWVVRGLGESDKQYL